MATAFASQLLEIRNSIDRILDGTATSGPTKGKKGKAAKEKSSRAGRPTAHGDFTKMVLKDHEADWKAFQAELKESSPDQKGAHLIFVKKYKDEHKEEYQEFETTWKAEHPKDAPSAAESVAGSDVEGSVSTKASNRKPMTDEHKAKLKAGREAAAAKKKAEKEAEEAAAKGEIAVAPASDFSATTEVKKVAKKPVKTVAKKPEPTPVVVPEPVEDDDPEFLAFKHSGKTYLRLGAKREDGNHLWATGHLWESKKGAKGTYVGCLQDDGTIDSTEEEPNLE